MATVITSDCINCGACEPECPNTAIYAGGVPWELNGQQNPAIAQDIYYIVPQKCTECVGFHDHEACAAVCPVDCCIPDPDIPETEDVLLARARQLHPEETFPDDAPSASVDLTEVRGAPAPVKLLMRLAEPILGAMPDGVKSNLERAVGDLRGFSRIRASALNMLLNVTLYPAVLMAFGVVVRGDP